METLIKEKDYIKYLIITEPDKYSSLEFTVWQVNSWNEENKPCMEDNEIFIRGSIKWDGCSNINFGDADGYLHLCGNKYFKDMKNVLDAVWKKAEQEIETFNKEIAY